jgi:hypothetical protein
MNIAILTLTVTAAAALTQNRAVTTLGAVPAAGAAVLGILRSSAASGQLVPVDVQGTAIAEAGAAISAGAALEVDNLGRVITKSSGVTVGRLAPGQSAAGAGALVEIVLIPN